MCVRTWFASTTPWRISTADLDHRSRITRENSENKIWGISQSIRYGTSPVPIMNTAAGTVDTGSTLVILASGTSFYWIWVLYETPSFCRRVLTATEVLQARSSIRPRSFFGSPQRNMPTSSRSSSPLATGHSSSQRTRRSDPCAQRAHRQRAGTRIPSRQRHWVDHTLVRSYHWLHTP